MIETRPGDVSVDGTEAAADAPLFFLDGRTLQPLRTNADEQVAVGRCMCRGHPGERDEHVHARGRDRCTE